MDSVIGVTIWHNLLLQLPSMDLSEPMAHEYIVSWHSGDVLAVMDIQCTRDPNYHEKVWHTHTQNFASSESEIFSMTYLISLLDSFPPSLPPPPLSLSLSLARSLFYISLWKEVHVTVHVHVHVTTIKYILIFPWLPGLEC